MRKNVFYLFMLLFSLSIFASCKDDNNDTPGEVEGADIAGAMSGIYKGRLDVKLDGIDLGNSIQFVYITKEEATKVKLELRDFSINIAGTDVSVGDILIPNIPVEGSITSATIQETATVIQHPALGQLDIKVTGTVADGKADLYITVYAALLRQNIEVTFSGLKTDSDIDETDYAAEAAAWYKRESLTITGDTVDSKYPDGIEFLHQGFNSIEITSFYISFPSVPPNKTTTQQIHVDSVKLIKVGNGLLIDTVKMSLSPRGGHDSTQLVLSGRIQGENLTLNMHISSTKGVAASYVYTALKKMTGCNMEKMTIVSDLVLVQPEIEKKVGSAAQNVVFYVKPETTPEQLNLIPVFEISDGAVVMYKSKEYVAGTPIDFSKEQSFNVKSQSGTKFNTYKIKAEKLVTIDFASDFEAWELRGSILPCEEPANGWATSNEGVSFIKALFPHLYPMNAPFAVIPTEDAKSGKAAKLETLFTTGQAGAPPFMPAIPKVTSGTVFCGAFIVDMSNTLKSTKFGYPCFEKPVSFQGSYKYTPGKVYLECKEPINNADKTDTITTKTDAPGINAVLYEVDSYGFDFLDGTNLLTSDRIVAKASLEDRSAKENYTDFKIAFDFGSKKFDPTKKYKLAIVCSSSIDGDRFTGAPGSVLYVDDLKVNF